MTDVRLTALNPEDSKVYPVACNTSGELKLEKQATFDGNLNGDLKVSGSVRIRNKDQNTNNLRDSQTTSDREAELQINSSNGVDSSIGLISWNGADSGFYSPQFWLAKSNGSVGSNVVVTNDTDLGAINFAGNDGASFLNAASIRAEVDGTAGSDNMPGRLVLSTTADGKSAPTERLRISSSGNVGIGTQVPQAKLDVAGDVVVGSRSKQWMLVEQGGLCHMVEQVVATTADLVDPATAEYPKLRDVFKELNTIERCLEEIMTKLRMTEPDGWPVWDGSDNSR